MTMNFELLEDSVTTLLTNAEAGRYTTIGYETRSQSGADVQDSDRTVQVFYDNGDFDKRGGSIRGPVPHDMTFKIILTVSKATEVDIATLTNSGSSPAQIISALAAKKYAEKLASKSFNELSGIIWNILMDVQNKDLGLAADTVTSRWCEKLVKDSSLKYGRVVVVTGGILMTCRMNEEITGVSSGTAIAENNTTLQPTTVEAQDPLDGPQVTNNDY